MENKMNSLKPLIGITTNGRWEFYYKLRIEYVDAVRRAGGIPVMLPPGETALDALLERLDGVIFSGGLDLNPALYNGQSDHPALSRFDDERDETEVALARKLMNLRLPVLFICRGLQVFNVALGGTLIEHVPDVVGEITNHRLSDRQPTSHAISVEAHSNLAQVMAGTEVETASWHHQSVRKPADGLQVIALSPDGIIEALEIPE
jgi:putative glutamine amidotransferase